MSKTIGIIFIALAFACFIAYLATPVLVRNTSLVSGELDVHETIADAIAARQIVTASFAVAFTKTHLQVSYDSPVRHGSAANVRAKIFQSVVYIRDKTFPGDEDVPDPQTIETLEWPIKLRLNSAAFEFAEKERDKFLRAGTHLPVEVLWAPIAKSEGDSILVMSFDNIDGTKTSSPSGRYFSGTERFWAKINGESIAIRSNDELSLPISIHTKGGVPAWLWEYLTMGGAVAGFVLGSTVLMGALQKMGELAKRGGSSILSKVRRRVPRIRGS